MKIVISNANGFSVEVSEIDDVDCHELAALARDLYQETRPPERPMATFGFSQDTVTRGGEQ